MGNIDLDLEEEEVDE